jgi:hypothetical protein
MTNPQPNHHDAELVLRVYELRREPIMRDARNAINGQFWPKSTDDVIALTRPDHPLNAAWRQTTSYWEMVYSFARHGVVDANFWAENNGEGLFLFAKVAPHIDTLRRDVSPVAFRNTEWIARESAEGRRIFEQLSGRVAKMLEAR